MTLRLDFYYLCYKLSLKKELAFFLFLRLSYCNSGSLRLCVICIYSVYAHLSVERCCLYSSKSDNELHVSWSFVTDDFNNSYYDMILNGML